MVLVGSRRGRAGGGCCSADVRVFDEGGGCGSSHRGDPDGAVYRMLRAALPRDVAVEVVDAGNWAWLLPALTADARRAHLRGPDLLHRVRAGLRAGSVLVDGEPVAELAADPESVLAAVRARLEQPAGRVTAGRAAPPAAVP
ncbi:MAG TPA: hypothetical protein VNU26_18975 [Mycobacteriales bacterium]|nr:hypothetical protein [Mycobacteriales bacterium]